MQQFVRAFVSSETGMERLGRACARWRSLPDRLRNVQYTFQCCGR